MIMDVKIYKYKNISHTCVPTTCVCTFLHQ